MKHFISKYFKYICVFLLTIVLAIFMYTGNSQSNQSKSAMYPPAEFQGQFKIADGEWQPYIKGEHIPATKGDVTLKGRFNLIAPDTGESLGTPGEGTPIALHLNHLGGEIIEDNGNRHILDTELSLAEEDMCGVMIIGYNYMGGEEITIKLHNPHKFGNEKAIDDFLDNLSVYGGTAYENDIMDSGSMQRNIGIILLIFAFMILGTAIFSMLIHFKNGNLLWLIGFAVLFSGLYFMFTSQGIMFFSEIIQFNTRVLGASMMLYMLSVTAFLVTQLKTKAKKIGNILVTISVITDIIFLLLPVLTDIKFYDTWGIWAIIQSIACLIMTGFLAHAFSAGEKGEEMIYAFGMLPIISFIVDVFGTYIGWWQGGFLSGIAFLVLFAISFILLLRIIPKNINAAMQAKELETEKKMLKAELAENRIAIMISQIQPHFIYNTLGTIEQLCITEPEQASKLVRNFTLYLRGNFSELDNAKPIKFSQEMNHVKHYTDIEQVRFPDMTIQYDLRSVEFTLPALSVQPLVENAIKHGLMGLEEGGIVTISAYETDTHFIVEVKDDGIGFDTSAGYDERKHIGIKNIRTRIEAMCNGTLTIESTVGKGTKATMMIPKEAEKNDCNNC